MGRGDDQKLSKAPSRRNPFRQEIKDSPQKEAKAKRKKQKARREKAQEPVQQFLRDQGWEERSEVAFADERSDVEKESGRQALLDELGLDREKEPFWSVAHMIDEFSGTHLGEYSTSIYLYNEDTLQYVIRHDREYPGENLRSGFVALEEKERAIEEINHKKEELAEKARESFIRAAKMQARLAEILKENGINDFSKNSPAGELLLEAGRGDLFSFSGMLVNHLFPEAYGSEVVDSYNGSEKVWRVFHPFTGRLMAEGRALTEEAAAKAAEDHVRKNHKAFIEEIKEKEKVFKKRKDIFAGLDAVMSKRGRYLTDFSGDKINLAQDLDLENLKRKDLGDGYSLVVGQRVFRGSEPTNTLQKTIDITGLYPFGFKDKVDLILVFKDGKMLSSSSGPEANFVLEEKGISRSRALMHEGEKRIARHKEIIA